MPGECIGDEFIVVPNTSMFLLQRFGCDLILELNPK
jgi:hypothetical protein